jgi:hypothetical protein
VARSKRLVDLLRQAESAPHSSSENLDDSKTKKSLFVWSFLLF